MATITSRGKPDIHIQRQPKYKKPAHDTRHALTLRIKSPVVAVHNKDKALRVLIVVAPEGADLVLATHIPNSEADVLVSDRNTSLY